MSNLNSDLGAHRIDCVSLASLITHHSSLITLPSSRLLWRARPHQSRIMKILLTITLLLILDFHLHSCVSRSNDRGPTVALASPAKSQPEDFTAADFERHVQQLRRKAPA